MGAKITLTNASFSYGEKNIFNNLDLKVSGGEIFCLLGSNGCGKTTLLSCINGILKLNTGEVLLDDRNISSMGATEIARKIGFIFQEHNAPFPYTVLEVVSMGRAPHLKLFSSPSAEDMKIAETALEKVGISHLRNHRYTQISGGERQLVLIARTLTQEPEVILLDEPTSHLDFKNQTTVLQIVNQLAEQGMSIMMTSHYPDHALLFSSRVALMKDGQFLGIGKPTEVMTDEALAKVYDMEVSIITVDDPNTRRNLKLCVPRLKN
jgi:iron complex transport system ATP-binding protein